jgi:Tol biopolymer transport system component
VRVTSGPADDSQPRFSADGNSIFFISNRVDRYGVTGVYGTERRGTNVWSVAHFDRP